MLFSRSQSCDTHLGNQPQNFNKLKWKNLRETVFFSVLNTKFEGLKDMNFYMFFSLFNLIIKIPLLYSSLIFSKTVTRSKTLYLCSVYKGYVYLLIFIPKRVKRKPLIDWKQTNKLNSKYHSFRSKRNYIR